MEQNQHFEFFFEFVKNSGIFNFSYSEQPVEQKIITFKEGFDTKLASGYAIINPDWDKVYQSFLNIDHNKQSVDYIKKYVEDGNAVSLITETIKYLISKNIDSEKVYIEVGNSWNLDWADELLGV